MSNRRAYCARWSDLPRWDLKSARAAAFRRLHPAFRPLGDFIEEATVIVRPMDEPEKLWPVYGVNNRVGVVLSHHQPGAEFNAAYKHIERDWFFHNPTRANVGSLGRVPEVPPDALTSPEYQVWRIRHGLLPDFVEILIRLPFFLDLVECHRVGAVKERLFVENLKEIPIPPLSEAEQRGMVERWKKEQASIERVNARIAEHEAGIPKIIYDGLGTPAPVPRIAKKKLMVLRWTEVERWSFTYLDCSRAGLVGFTKSRFPIVRLGEHLEETMNGYSIKPVEIETPHRMLKLSALKREGLDFSETKFVTVPDEIAERFSVRADDVRSVLNESDQREA